MDWLLALAFRNMRRRDDSTWSLAFFTPPLLGDKVSGNLEWRRARLIGRVLPCDQIGAHEPQYMSRIERQSGMARVRLLDGIHRKKANGVDAELVQFIGGGFAGRALGAPSGRRPGPAPRRSAGRVKSS
jgi:hypothetical protein